VILGFLGVAGLRVFRTRRDLREDHTDNLKLQSTRQFWETYRQANQKRAAGELEMAVPIYQEALRMKPNHEDSLYYLGNCLFELQRFPEAINTYQRLTAVNPLGSSRGYMQLGLLYADLDPGAPWDLKKASQYFQKTRQVDPDSGAMLAVGEVALLQQEWKKAEEALQTVNTDSPMGMAAPYLLGYLAHQKSQKNEAWKWFQLAVQRGELKKPQLKWTEEGDVKANPELRWRALARQSVFGRYWLPLRKYLNAPDLSPATMEREYQKLKEVLLTKVESPVLKKSF
jgi:tetratricopeptide (TPR) repeat protein